MRGQSIDAATALEKLGSRMEDHLAAGARARFPQSLFRWPSEPAAKLEAGVDWTALPDRIVTCLGRSKALEVLDLPDERIGDGGRRLQEEYVEWSVVRTPRGIERVDITAETSDYWSLLAAYSPDRVLELIGQFAQEPPARTAIFGSLDPFAPETTPSMREIAFGETMLRGGTSPYNNGVRAITCMVHPSNTIAALLELLVGAGTRHGVEAAGGVSRCPTCLELAPFLGDAAQLGRSSDPVIVERLAQLAFEGRRMTLDVPGPLAITGVEHARLRTPDGGIIPSGWFVFSRPMRPASRFQRLSLTVPHDDFCISDLRDVATEEKITTGGQIADLVQMSLHLLATPPSQSDARATVQIGESSSVECRDVLAVARALEHRLPL